jgi:hypothetical protein
MEPLKIKIKKKKKKRKKELTLLWATFVAFWFFLLRHT